jgi:hypothetical protein
MKASRTSETSVSFVTLHGATSAAALYSDLQINVIDTFFFFVFLLEEMRELTVRVCNAFSVTEQLRGPLHSNCEIRAVLSVTKFT